jgi:hypothetical protein
MPPARAISCRRSHHQNGRRARRRSALDDPLFDLVERKICVPGPDLAAAIAGLARTEDYGAL